MFSALKEAAGGYPFTEGKRGIPFGLVKSTSGFLTSGSGRPLFFSLARKRLEIYDHTQWQSYFMTGLLDKGALWFNLQTRKIEEGVRVYHPDFFAERFKELTLRYFEGQKFRVSCLVSEWYRPSGERVLSDNYEQFMKTFSETGDARDAAASTWVGRTAARLGFAVVRSVKIPKGSDPELIRAYFKRG